MGLLAAAQLFRAYYHAAQMSEDADKNVVAG